MPPSASPARVVVRPLRRAAFSASKAVLSANRPLFLRAYDGWDRRRVAPPPAADSRADRVLADLRRDGFARWAGFFSAGEVAALSREFTGVLDERETPPDAWKRVVGADASDGRARAFADCRSKDDLPPACARLFDDPRLTSVVRRYYDGVNTWCRSIMIERLSLTPNPGAWHFDKIFDQVKAMILLSDVEPEHGPIRYKLGTHRDRPSFVNLFLHESFKRGAINGLDYAYPPQPLIEKLPHESVLGCGRAGDVLLFDTLGLHTGTTCRRGERRVIVAAYNAQTPRNNRLYQLLFPDRAA
jgi:hypothetical protein